ncbi:hypothetical protein ABZ721_13690 [Streptomyces sp. NPDC006733]|uniref:hypothetical protein n=1 Tax=Streptomyces sp. NPDC006733 TaxID=3155460 RepID=UPI00340BD683
MTSANEPAWADLLVNRPALDAFHSAVPALESLTVRSVHLDRRGPTLILRFDSGSGCGAPAWSWRSPAATPSPWGT